MSSTSASSASVSFPPAPSPSADVSFASRGRSRTGPSQLSHVRRHQSLTVRFSARGSSFRHLFSSTFGRFVDRNSSQFWDVPSLCRYR